MKYAVNPECDPDAFAYRLYPLARQHPTELYPTTSDRPFMEFDAGAMVLSLPDDACDAVWAAIAAVDRPDRVVEREING